MRVLVHLGQRSGDVSICGARLLASPRDIRNAYARALARDAPSAPCLVEQQLVEVALEAQQRLHPPLRHVHPGARRAVCQQVVQRKPHLLQGAGGTATRAADGCTM